VSARENPRGALIHDLPIAHPLGFPVYPTASPHVVLIRSLQLAQPFGPPVYPTASPHVVFSLWIEPRIAQILDWGAYAPRVLVVASRDDELYVPKKNRG